MTATKKTMDETFDDYAKLICAAHVKELESLGLDIIEAEREGPYVIDHEGRRYVDCNTSGAVFNLGRRHPELLAEMKRAMVETDQGNFPMISREKAALAEMLADFTPGDLECSVFSVVRGEAFEFACKLARGYTGKAELVAPDGSWFGQTGFAVSLSDRPDRSDFAPLIPEVLTIPFGDIDGARQTISKNTAALFLEPVQAENHCRAVGGDWLRALRDHCHETGTLLVFDETQTGLGRTGKRFAFEHFGVTPDVLIIGEALGAGIFPIAATVFTQEINTFLNDHPMIHLSTFGGSDLGCRVACRALDIYTETRPWENARALGMDLKSGIEKIAAAHGEVIRSVAGMGLLLSLDLGTPERAARFCRETSRAGVLASPGSVARHSVLLRPSLTVTSTEIGLVLEGIEAAVGALA